VTVQRRKNIHLVPPNTCQKKYGDFLFQTISKTISYLSQGREGGLVIDVDGGSTILTTTTLWSYAISTITTTPVSAIPTAIPTTIATATSTTFGTFETDFDFKVYLVLLFGTSLGSGLGLWY
jgi:hypothetical protein